MSISHLTDFSDRLSPMLVKELRQGLRAKTFIAVFLSLQAFLAVMMFSATVASSANSIGNVVSGIIFGFFSVAVLVVQPLRGISALSSEMKSNTLDMMALTRLSSWRIGVGKWVAIVSQTALLLSTIVPYLILRYFFGGMNLVGELVMLALIFLSSVFLTAFTVGLSGCTSAIIRALLPIFGLPALLFTMGAGLGGVTRGDNLAEFFALSDGSSRIAVASYVIGVTYFGYSMLSLGASLIAPAAENHSFWRRALALAAMLVVIPLCYFEVIEEVWHIILVFSIAVPAIIIALSESAPLVSTVCKPFIKRGPIGKAAGWLFYPILPSGVVYALVLAGLGIFCIFIHPFFRDSRVSANEDAGVFILAFMGSLFFPAVLQMFSFRGDGQRLANYLLILVGSYVMLGILYILAEAMSNEGFMWFFAWHPLAFIVLAGEDYSSSSLYLSAVTLVDFSLAVLLTGHALLQFRKAATVVMETEKSLQAD